MCNNTCLFTLLHVLVNYLTVLRETCICKHV